MGFVLGCDSTVVGPAPPGGYSKTPVTYKEPETISDTATVIELPNLIPLVEDQVPVQMTFPKLCRVGDAFVFTGNLSHPDSRMLSATIRANITAQGANGTRITLGGKLGDARLGGKLLRYEFQAKIPESQFDRVTIDLFVDTIKPGYDGTGVPESWIVLIASGQINVDRTRAPAR